MNPEDRVNLLSRLVELVAAHGVYALSIIFIFYQQRRSHNDMQNATPEDHAYMRKVYTSVVVATYVLVGVSTVIWIYATFFYIQRTYVKGSVMDLTEQSVPPQKAQDPPKLVEQVTPESFEIDLYESKKYKDKLSKDGKYDLGWVLLPHENLQTLVFQFQHHYEIWKPREASSDPFTSEFSANLESQTISKNFRLSLQSIHYSPGSSIQLIYQPDTEDPVRKVGRMFVRSPSAVPVEVPWEGRSSESRLRNDSRTTGFSLLRTVIAYANPVREDFIFKESGEYDPQTGRLLRQRLGSSDLRTQLGTRHILVENGSRSFKFVRDSLSESSATSYDRELLIHNLAKAVEEIRSAGYPAPRDIHLKLALAFYGIQDYESSANFFDKAGDEPIDRDETYFYRAFAYSQTGQNEKAIGDYEKYLSKAHGPYLQALTHYNLGVAYHQLGRDDAAIEHYQKAKSIYPAYPKSYNNLAYIYAERGEKLTEALSLVNHAIELDRNNALFKDTKGWILFKMGKYDDALSLLKEAAAAAPCNPQRRKHLEEAQKAIGSLKGKLGFSSAKASNK